MLVNVLKFRTFPPVKARDFSFYDYFVNISPSSNDYRNCEIAFWDPNMSLDRAGFLEHDLVKDMIDGQPLNYLKAKMACLRYAIKTWPEEAYLVLRHGCNDVYKEMKERGYEAEALREIANLTAEIPDFSSIAGWLKIEALCLEAEETPLSEWVPKFKNATFRVARSRTGNLVIGRLLISPEITAVKAVLYGDKEQKPEFPALADMENVRFGHYFELDNRGTQWGAGLQDDQGYAHEGCYPPEGALKLNVVANTNNWHCDWVSPNPFSEELFDFSDRLKLTRSSQTFVLPIEKAIRANGWEAQI